MAKQIKVSVELEGREVFWVLSKEGNEDDTWCNMSHSDDEFKDALLAVVDTAHKVARHKIELDHKRKKDPEGCSILI